jgi:hypothetical protein
VNCDPLDLAQQYIGKIKTIQAEADRAFALIPGTLEDLTRCLAFGTAGRAGLLIDPDALEGYDADSLEKRVQSIFDAVETGLETVGEVDTAHGRSGDVDFASATSGLWLSQDPANTFYGLAAARAEGAIEQAAQVPLLTAQAREAILQAQLAVAGLAGPEGQALLEAARLWTEEICPEVSAIVAELRAIADGVATSQDLTGSLCNGVTLEDRILALMARVPNAGLARVMAVIEATRKLEAIQETLTAVQTDLVSVQTDLPGFEAQLEAGGFSSQTEQRLPIAIAEQFADVCQRIAALAERNRWAEMVALGPELREIGAIAVTTLRQSPQWRVDQVKSHGLRDGHKAWMDELEDLDEQANGDTFISELWGDIPASIVGLSHDIDQLLVDYGEYLTEIETYAQVISSGATEFLGLASELLDVACVGALRALLFELGYDELSDLYAQGLFGEIPDAIYDLATNTGRLIKCVGGVLNGELCRIPLSPGQQASLEIATDTLRTLEDADHEVARIARELDGFLREAPITWINEISAAIEDDLLGGLRGQTLPPLPSAASIVSTFSPINPCIDGTSVDSDGFVKQINPDADLGRGVTTDANGYLISDPSAVIPPGYERLPNGYLKATDLGL